MNRLLRSLLLVASVLVPTHDAAESQERVPTGAEVRVSAPSLGLVKHRGTLDEWADDHIRVDGITIARDAISELEVGRDVNNLPRFALIGFLAGTALGATVCLIECRSNDSDVPKGGFMLMYAGVAGGGGLAVGAVAGALTHRTEWRSVPGGGVQPILGRTSDGRLLLGLRILR